MASSSPISSAKGDGAPPRSVIIETGHLFVGQLPACWRMHDLQSFHLCGSLFIKDLTFRGAFACRLSPCTLSSPRSVGACSSAHLKDAFLSSPAAALQLSLSPGLLL